MQATFRLDGSVSAMSDILPLQLNPHDLSTRVAVELLLSADETIRLMILLEWSRSAYSLDPATQTVAGVLSKLLASSSTGLDNFTFAVDGFYASVFARMLRSAGYVTEFPNFDPATQTLVKELSDAYAA